MRDAGGPGWKRTAIGWGLLFFGVFAFQSAAARRMHIPSESMMPTLLTGDRIIVSKYPYGWSYASPAIHGSGVVPGRLLGRYPERGDVVTVARRGDGADLIKRVIGLPGDAIEVRGGRLILNGKPVRRVSLGPARLRVDANLPCDRPSEARFRRLEDDGVVRCAIPRYRETLPNGASYDTLDMGASPGDEYGPITVPAGHLFLMGDNRDNSADSRFPLEAKGLGGPVPFESIIGRAQIVTNTNDGDESWLNPLSWVGDLRGGRALTSLRPATVAE